MKNFKQSELKKTSAEYWILESIKKNILTYDNPVKYQGYLIYPSDEVDHKMCGFTWVHEDYDGAPDAYDHRHGFGASIEGCIMQINEYILENEVEN